MGVSLSSQQIRLFEVYAVQMKKWNNKVNLTAITKDAEIAVKHFIDSLSLVPYITAETHLLDIGSGAGLPVIPLKILRPEIEMVSVDAVAKKINFQRHVIRILNLHHIDALHARVEDLHGTYNKSFSIITSRAFNRLDRFVSLAVPLLAEDGVMIAMKGYAAADAVAARCGEVRYGECEVTAVHRYTLPLGMGDRVLTFIKPRKAPLNGG
jgi:16S rRNA (guanine527-N7)-methyltransferase